MNNPNHPPKGSSIKVDPIRRVKDIKAIKALLSSKPRDYCLFTLGINTNLRITDLLMITAGDVRELHPGDVLKIDGKTPKGTKGIRLNKECIRSIQALFNSRHYLDHDFLFSGQRGVLTLPSVNRLVKKWTRSINLKGNFGSHTLRKTFGYQQRVKYGVAIPLLMETFKHSTKRQTLNYLCIKNEKVRSIYENEI